MDGNEKKKEGNTAISLRPIVNVLEIFPENIVLALKNKALLSSSFPFFLYSFNWSVNTFSLRAYYTGSNANLVVNKYDKIFALRNELTLTY